jgi:methylenetetrahydrofolate dehydrogenase (NADP+)/methenyltetrahydrofolate cyclohydrolase
VSRAERLHTEKGIKPGLATVLVGEDPASHSYVRAKRKACERDGIASFHHELAAETSEEQLLALIGRAGR